jgi:hypothetical protein
VAFSDYIHPTGSSSKEHKNMRIGRGNHCITMKKVPSIKEDNRKINFA